MLLHVGGCPYVFKCYTWSKRFLYFWPDLQFAVHQRAHEIHFLQFPEQFLQWTIANVLLTSLHGHIYSTARLLPALLQSQYGASPEGQLGLEDSLALQTCPLADEEMVVVSLEGCLVDVKHLVTQVQ